MINKLEWDSEFFGFPVGEIHYLPQSKFIDLSDYRLIYVKSDKDFDLQLEGFINSFSEVKVVFTKKLIAENASNENVVSFNPQNHDIRKLYSLGYESGKYSRFKLDPNFEHTDFNRLYDKWIDNSVNRKFADEIMVYENSNEISGFVTYKIDGPSATIGLIAVDVTVQRLGVGRKLITAVENRVIEKNVQTLLIPTQESNIQACNFYEKQGFTIIEKTYIKHYWKK